MLSCIKACFLSWRACKNDIQVLTTIDTRGKIPTRGFAESGFSSVQSGCDPLNLRYL